MAKHRENNCLSFLSYNSSLWHYAWLVCLFIDKGEKEHIETEHQVVQRDLQGAGHGIGEAHSGNPDEPH